MPWEYTNSSIYELRGISGLGSYSFFYIQPFRIKCFIGLRYLGSLDMNSLQWNDRWRTEWRSVVWECVGATGQSSYEFAVFVMRLATRNWRFATRTMCKQITLIYYSCKLCNQIAAGAVAANHKMIRFRWSMRWGRFNTQVNAANVFMTNMTFDFLTTIQWIEMPFVIVCFLYVAVFINQKS